MSILVVNNRDIMRKILATCILIVLVSFLTLPVLSKESDKAEMKFEETIHDFGSIKENGGPVSVEFPFTNSGDANLVVYEAKAECGCTIPEFPKAPVAPGKTGKIKVTYNPLGRPGIFEKVITVKSNGKKSKVRLKIRGTVVPKSKQ